MALKGTIKDFGIADIFQLIGHQTKTGVLILRDEIDEVRVYFQSGAVVRAESSSRPKNMLLGAMLINAEVVTAEQLDRALAEQQRTLKKLGTVLTELGLASEEDIREFTRLQMTETVYRLFAWDSGTYEFEQSDTVNTTETVEPIRAETNLMEGLRMIDEWPVLRKRLPSYTILAERVKPLPDAPDEREDDLDLDVFGLEGSDAEAGARSGPASATSEIGANERRVYGLMEYGRDVQKLVHLSRLGEFETCRAVLNLVNAGYARLAEKPPITGDLDPALALVSQRRFWPLRVASYAAIAVIAAALLRVADAGQIGIDLGPDLRYRPAPAQEHLAKGQLRVIERALELYRLSHGGYPAELDALAKTALLRERDLRFPFEDRYYYRKQGEGYVLLPPIR